MRAHPPPMMNLEPEMQGLDLGDARRNRRHRRILDVVTRNPSASFPQLMSSKAELEALYRHFNNPKISLEKCLAPHAAATVSRCQQAAVVLVAHDTSEIDYAGEGREDLGELSGDERGYFLHLSLAMTADGLRRPLGVVAADTWVRPEAPKNGPKKKSGQKRYDDPTKESMCWTRNAKATERLLEGKASVIHLGDRGSDSYDLLVLLSRLRFVSRANHNRNVLDPETLGVIGKLREATAGKVALLEREVSLSERLSKGTPKANRTHPPRRRRPAKLEVRATSVTVPRPDGWSKELPEHLSLNLVHVTERDCPPGEEPVEWVLYTNEPIDTAEQVAFVVDCYRSRWLIEEYFKSLYTGCSLKKRQLESLHALKNVLATFLPIAWRLLLLRNAADERPDEPATVALTERQLQVLRKFRPKENLPEQPTVEQAFYAVASLGGHLKHNGRPGWIVLGRGYEKLLAYELGWVAALS